MGEMLLGVALTVVLAALSGPPQPKTVVHETVWFKAGRPAPGLVITEDVAGHCSGPARSSPRADAWRCFADEHWIDPCFSATARSRSVLCPTDPWSNTVRLVELTRRLPPVVARRARPDAALGHLDREREAMRARRLRRDAAAGRAARALRVRGQRLPRRLPDARGRTWTIGYVPRFALGKPNIHARPIGITDVWR